MLKANKPMFTCAKIRNGSTDLGGHLTTNDYYCKNEKVQGRWTGLAAERLGIEGDAMPSHFSPVEHCRITRAKSPIFQSLPKDI